MSQSTIVPAGGEEQRRGPIRRDLPPRASESVLVTDPPPAAEPPRGATPPAPAATAPAPTSPARPGRPPQMWLALALSAVLVALLVVRNLVEAATLNSDAASGASSMTAESAGWIIDTSFVVALAFAAVAVYAFTGSRLGRGVFTVFLVAAAALGVVGVVGSLVAAAGDEQLLIGSAQPFLMALMSLAFVAVSIAVIVLLYRPEVSRYFLDDAAATAPHHRDRDLTEPPLPYRRR